MEDDPGVDPKDTDWEALPVKSVMWWTMLAIGVLAVAAFGLAVSAIVPFGEFGKLLAFILACWLCLYLGMRIMDHPRMSNTIGSDKEES